MPATADPRDLAPLYDSRYERGYMAEDRFAIWSHSGVERRRVLDTLALVPRSAVTTILDYGCGTGEWGGALAGRFGGARLSGVEISGTALRLAESRHPGPDYRRLDGTRAPWPDGAFDLLFSYHVLEHVADPGAAADDMVRLTRAGGYLAVICPCGNPGSLEERLVSRVRGGMETGPGGERRFFYEDPAHLRRLTSADARRLFESRGMRLCGELYAHQLFGALEWIARAGRGFVSELLAAKAPRGPGAALWLAGMRALLWPLALCCDLAQADPSRSAGGIRRLLLRAAWPARLAARAVPRLLQGLAAMEWRLRQRRPNGSAQFLVFRKPEA